MTNTLTNKPDLSPNLSIYDPAVLALFAKASYEVRKLGNNITEKASRLGLDPTSLKEHKI